MMQEDIIAILRASPVPMTAREILEAKGEGQDQMKHLQNSLRMLRKYGIIRQAGTVPSHRPGATCYLWEASQ